MAVKLQIHKIILRYILIGILGTIVVSLACSIYQVLRIKNRISQADILFKANSVDAALGKLLQAELWARRYPTLAVELNVAAIKCHVKRRDMHSAEETAKNIYQGIYSIPRRSASLAEIVQYPPSFVVNLFLNNIMLNNFSGYEELVTAVRQSGNYDRLVAVSKEIIALDPNSPLAQNVKTYIPADPAALAQEKNAQTTQVVVATNKIEEIPQTPAARRKLLERYVERKIWDKALKECEILLKDEPDDMALLELRRLAAANGRRWGVVKSSNSPAYDTSGKFLKSMPPGTILEINDIIKTAREELVLCSVVAGESPPAATFLMRDQDLTIQTGDFKKLDEDQQKLFKREAELTAGIATQKAKLISSAVDSQNPFAGEYKAAKKAHEAYWATVRELQKKRDDAGNSDEKMRYSDELRKLKGEDIRLGMALSAAKKNYDEAATTASANVKSPELDAMESELAGVRENIRSIKK